MFSLYTVYSSVVIFHGIDLTSVYMLQTADDGLDFVQ